MLNRMVKKLLIFLLCFACSAPFLGTSIRVAQANSNYDQAVKEKTVFVGTEYKFEVEGNKEVVIYGKKSTEKDYSEKPIFEKNNDTNKEDNYIVSFASTGSVLSITFTKTGTYNIKFHSKSDTAEINKEYTFNVTDKIENIKLNYIANDEDKGDDSVYKKYKDEIQKVVVGTEEANALKLGKNFEIPNLDSLIYTQIPYNSLNKQVYYSAPGSSSYSTASALSGTPKFKVSAYGTYVYYVLFSTDNLTDNNKDSVKMTVDYLREELDGFYQYVIENTATEVYYSKVSEKFYASKEEADEGEGAAIENAVKGSLVIPKFTFTLENKGPVIEITSSYQEKGYIGSSYSITSITVNGSENTTYKLFYKEKLDSAEEDVTDREEEGFDASALTFTPAKEGFYYVKVFAVDSVGNRDEDKTAYIEVASEFVHVSYKVGFADWLEKNTLPFILLCISGACLIAIVCLIFIKPKDATSKKAIKKVDDKNADR
ncbi:MAG: hypothetical protein IKV61_06445 [Clostridia bacterium]|nr:hypothetical protein [Clostridia bacterium]